MQSHKLACRSMSLHAVTEACMQYHKHARLHAVPQDCMQCHKHARSFMSLYMQFISLSEQLTRISQCLLMYTAGRGRGGPDLPYTERFRFKLVQAL